MAAARCTGSSRREDGELSLVACAQDDAGAGAVPAPGDTADADTAANPYEAPEEQTLPAAPPRRRRGSVTILVLAIIFAFAATFLGLTKKAERDQALAPYAELADDERIPQPFNLGDGWDHYTAGELREILLWRVIAICSPIFLLAGLWFGLYALSFWRPLLAIGIALSVFVGLQVLSWIMGWRDNTEWALIARLFVVFALVKALHMELVLRAQRRKAAAAAVSG